MNPGNKLRLLIFELQVFVSETRSHYRYSRAAGPKADFKFQRKKWQEITEITLEFHFASKSNVFYYRSLEPVAPANYSEPFPKNKQTRIKHAECRSGCQKRNFKQKHDSIIMLLQCQNENHLFWPVFRLPNKDYDWGSSLVSTKVTSKTKQNGHADQRGGVWSVHYWLGSKIFSPSSQSSRQTQWKSLCLVQLTPPQKGLHPFLHSELDSCPAGSVWSKSTLGNSPVLK